VERPPLERGTTPAVAAAGQPFRCDHRAAAEHWDLELDDLFLTIGYRKNSWQLAEQAGHLTPDGLQHLLADAKREPDNVRVAPSRHCFASTSRSALPTRSHSA
jgi:hypothetical protein